MSGEGSTARAKRLFLSLLAGTIVLRMLYSVSIPMTSDEAYFWVWSRHLDFGYYDHPPLIAWLIAFFTRIGGDTAFWTRLAAGLCLAGTSYLIYLLGCDLGGPRVGLTAGIFSLVSTVTTLGSVVVSTDSPVLLFWPWTVYLVWRAVKTGRAGYWYPAGITLGLGMMSKFLMIPLIAAVFLFLLLSRDDRHWLRRKEPYLALALALLIFAPFLVWNARHHWATFAFNTMRHKVVPSLVRPLGYLALQAVMVGPVLYVPMLWALIRQVRRVAGRGPDLGMERRPALFLLLCGWLLPFIFLLQSFGSMVGAHWPAAALAVNFVALAMELAIRRDRPQPGRRFPGRGIAVGAAAWTILFALLTIRPDLLPVKSIQGHSVGEVYGWEELGRKVSALHKSLGGECIVATNSYAFSSMLSFYTPDHLEVSLLGPGSKYGRSFDLWDRWNDWIDRDVLFINTEPIEDDPMAVKILETTCHGYQALDPIELHRQGQVVRRIYPVLGHRLKPDPYTAVRRSYIW